MYSYLQLGDRVMGKVGKVGKVLEVLEVVGWAVFVGGPSVAMAYMVAKLAMVIFGLGG